MFRTLMVFWIVVGLGASLYFHDVKGIIAAFVAIGFFAMMREVLKMFFDAMGWVWE